MSDYIAELRRELVDAAERERRTRLPRHAVARTRRLAGPVLAAAAVLLAIAVLVGVLRGEQRSTPLPARPQVAASFALDGHPEGATLSGQSVFVLRSGGDILRVDPRSHKITGAAVVGRSGIQIGASAREMWVTTRRGRGYRLLKVGDAGRTEPVRGLGALTGAPPTFAVSPEAVWIQGDPQFADHSPLVRVDAATGRVTGAYAAVPLVAVAADERVVWTLAHNGTLELRDARSGALLTKRGGFARARDNNSADSIALADDGDAFLATGGDGTVSRLDPDGRSRWQTDVDANGPLAVGAGSLWVGTSALDGEGDNEIVRLDPADGRVLQKLPLDPWVSISQLLAVSDDLWAVLTDGTVLVLR